MTSRLVAVLQRHHQCDKVVAQRQFRPSTILSAHLVIATESTLQAWIVIRFSRSKIIWINLKAPLLRLHIQVDTHINLLARLSNAVQLLSEF
jgi:hypothetical protein